MRTVQRSTPERFFSLQTTNEVSNWDNIFKAIALIGFLTICLIIVYKVVKS